jgi:hypothetical protein
LAHFVESWGSRQPHWEHAINHYLDTREPTHPGAATHP